jgi:hypothetical protein
MAARVPKHAHQMAIISHYDDWSKALVMCQTKPCSHTEYLQPGRVLVSGPDQKPRKFRPETAAEFEERRTALPHLCCA